MAARVKPLVLVADDDLPVLRMMEHCLGEWGYRASGLADKARLLEQMAQESPMLLLMDLQFGRHNGIELIRDLLGKHPGLAVVIMTGHGSIDSAVTAIKWGAFDYLTKPLDWNRLQVILTHALEKDRLSRRIQDLEQLIEPRDLSAQIAGVSPAMCQLREFIATVGITPATVLVLGESGTGKELVARAVHAVSPRAKGPFVPINVAALPWELAESTLFGHKKGAFTRADQAQMGCCEAANGGTLFLDEIGEMDLALQSKLLRFLQERTFQQVGASTPELVDVRVVAATNRDLLQGVRAGQFREDLYYRLNVVPIAVPPLRERREDIPVLADRFRRRASARCHKEMTGFTSAVLDRLSQHHWPGNVRELENLIERVVILAQEKEISVRDLPPEFRGAAAPEPVLRPEPIKASGTRLRRMEELEQEAILEGLQRARGNVREAARFLGLGQATVYRKMKRYGISLGGRDRMPTLCRQGETASASVHNPLPRSEAS
jgi:DNA-binding NtrC family response regulator